MPDRVTLADAVLEIARGELGVCESGGPNSGLPSARYMGGRKEPWCAWFIAWCFRRAGAPLPGDPGEPLDGSACALAGVRHLERVCVEHDWDVRKPMRGDIIVFRGRGHSDKGSTGMHVGLVERVSLTSVSVISGNDGDAVKLRSYYGPSLDALVSSYIRRPEPDGWVYRPGPLRLR